MIRNWLSGILEVWWESIKQFVENTIEAVIQVLLELLSYIMGVILEVVFWLLDLVLNQAFVYIMAVAELLDIGSAVQSIGGIVDRANGFVPLAEMWAAMWFIFVLLGIQAVIRLVIKAIRG